ncbi:B-cell linker protein isoform X2 [Scleropages formosus]|uniref:B-cell linker protein isoform X2 n=1 Tax=Scleropages formosus TaxID=113540 RepID=UPI000877FA09|nr:B-cell linker protein-like isoform X2 [Scleropages formosus]
MDNAQEKRVQQNRVLDKRAQENRSFFGKLKNLGPPAPPKRTENTAHYGWPEGEFDEEDGDTYEAPPCERPAFSVEHRPMEDNVYIERPPAPHVPSRQAPIPLPSKTAPVAKAMKPEPNRDLKETYFDPSLKKPPQVNRKKKPILNSDPPPRPAPVPVPVNIPAPQCEEDVYLDPNEGQDSDDLYLEPQEACSPSPRPAAWMHPPIKSLPCEPPPPIMKPPIPRAMANCPTASNAPAPEGRRPPFPVKRPPPTPVIKPLLPVSKPSPPAPPAVESHTTIKVSPVGPKSPSLSGPKQVSRLHDMEWFAGSCDRKEAESVLLGVKKDGAFLVRHSSAQSVRQPYTLVVLYQEKVYNIPVRFLEETQSYALGKEGKKTEEIFGSLQEIISHHMKNPILLIDSKSQAKQTTYLTHPAHP